MAIDPITLQEKMPAGFYPFWFWNDRIEMGEIRWQVQQMAAQGIKGFYIHPRQGLGQPYLSDAFFEMVAAAVDEARAQGLSVHLYDEYPYPSGAAGGEVVLGNPHYRATELVQCEYDVQGGAVRLELPRGTVLTVRAYPINEGRVNWQGRVDLRSAVGNQLTIKSYLETGLTAYNQKRFFASFPVPVLEVVLPECGCWRIFTAVQAEVTRHKYWGHFLDVLNPQAVGEFLRLTDDRYARYLAHEFGKSILSIFTDETFPGWSALLPGKFCSVYGYDLFDHLEALRDPTYPNALQVRVDLRNLVYRMFIDAFERPVAEKRRSLGLAYGGEKPTLRMSQLSYMDLPGCEPGHTKAGALLDLLQPGLRGNARATASAAYFYQKAGALDECFHSLGWSGTLQDAKLMVDGQILLGIRYLVPHGFFYSTHALRKHDAPPTFFFQMPYWPLFGKLSQYVDTLIKHFEGTHIAAEILLVEPSWGMPTRSDLEVYLRLQDWLMENHYDFMHVDTDILQSGRVEQGNVYLRDLAARVVIVPPMQFIEDELQSWLNHFAQDGGKVVYFGQNGDPADIAEDIAAVTAPRIRLLGKDGSPAKSVWSVCRTSRDKTLWFLVNTSSQPQEIWLDAGMPIHEIPLQEDTSTVLQQRSAGFWRCLAPFESCLLEAGSFEPVFIPSISTWLAGEAEIRLLSPNLVRMAKWQVVLLNGEPVQGKAAWVNAAPLANQLAESGLQISPRFVQQFGLEPRLEMPELRIRYQHEFDNQYTGSVHLVMEPGSIVGDWQIWVNECGPFGLIDFQPVHAHVRGAVGINITSCLMQGTNRLIVEVKTGRSDGGLLNPLYLAGEFGVIATPEKIVDRPVHGEFEDYQGNLLPYFSGVLEYDLQLDLPPLPECSRVAIQFETTVPINEAMEISINGGAFLPILWQPRKVELPRDSVHQGRNQAVVRVYTTLIRAFEGQWFDEISHSYFAVE